MKLSRFFNDLLIFCFRPARGAWIETAEAPRDCILRLSFAPHAGRGLKRQQSWLYFLRLQPFAPHAGRGLKQPINGPLRTEISFRPARGAWIETPAVSRSTCGEHFRPARGAWIETVDYLNKAGRRAPFAPHAGRGLKLTCAVWSEMIRVLSPRTRGVD